MDREVIQGFADLPFGVSLIVAEIHPEYRGNSRLVEAAKKILAHGNVEPASHTFFHPFSWTKRTLAYDGGSRSYSLEREVSEAANYLQTLVPIGKRIGTIYWSGDCMPPEKAFELAGRDGLLNLNGGDGVWDSEFPSIAYLAPLGRPVGKYFQVFSSNANDNIYTNGWEGPFYGFSKVKETFQRTGKPHILRPINPYFHFFLAEKAVGLKSLKEVLQWSLKQEISPIYPSEYIHSVMAYRNVKLHRLGKKTFRVGPLQGLTTLRVDARDAHLDLKASSGVLGYRRLNSSLYIHLAPNVSEAQVVLAAARRPSEKPHLKSVGGKVVSFIADNKKVVVKLGAFARPPLVLRGLTASATISKGAVVSSRVVGDGVNIDFPVKSEEQSIEVTL